MHEIKRLMPYIVAVGLLPFCLVIAFVLLGQVLLLVPPYLVGSTIDNLGGASQSGVYFSLSLILVFGLVRALLTPIQAKFITGFVQRVTLNFSVESTELVFGKNYELFKSSNVGGVLKRSERGIEGFESFLGFLLVLAIPASLSLLLIASYLTYLSGPVVLLCLAIAALIFVWLSNVIIGWRRQYIDDVNDAEDELAEVYSETFLAGTALKSSGRIQTAMQVLSGVYSSYAQRSTSLAFATGVLTASQELISTITIVIAIAAGAILVAKEASSVSVGDFVVIFTYVSMFMAGVAQLMEVRKKFDQYRADISELDRILGLPSERDSLPNFEIAPEIMLVEPFRLETGSKLSLDHKLEFELGTSVAVIGETGGGKSSFLELISGVRFTQDTVFIDSVDLGSVSAGSAANAVFYAPQMPRFLAGDFRRSVLFGHSVEQNELVRHVEGLGLSKFTQLIAGISFPASHLSGGEAKRFSLVRAMTADQNIVVLDEPTSELDDEIAEKVWKHLFHEFHGKLLICATHDSKSLDRFDHVIEVHKGKVSLSR